MNSTTAGSKPGSNKNDLEKVSPGDKLAFAKNRVWVIGCCFAILAAPFGWRIIFSEGGPTLCSFRSLFGLPCPGCGLTRAFCALSKLDWTSALHFNALSFPLALFFVVAPLVCITELVRGRPFQWYLFIFSSQFAKYALLVAVVFHAARTAFWFFDGTLFNDYFRLGQFYKIFCALYF